jgi:hypothetical protein
MCSSWRRFRDGFFVKIATTDIIRITSMNVSYFVYIGLVNTSGGKAMLETMLLEQLGLLIREWAANHDRGWEYAVLSLPARPGQPATQWVVPRADESRNGDHTLEDVNCELMDFPP